MSRRQIGFWLYSLVPPLQLRWRGGPGGEVSKGRTPQPGEPSGDKPRVERDLDAAEGLGDGAAFLGLAGGFLEGRFVVARHFGLVVEFDAGDLEALAHLLDVHLGRGGDALGREAGAAEAGRERHREAAGVRGADQLLGIGASRFLEARAERVAALEGAAPQSHRSLSLFEGPFPDRVGFTYGHDFLLQWGSIRSA